jgi:Leucine-rich repeat (LRR) protein
MITLRELNISGNDRLKTLSNSLNKLCNLEILDISQTSLSKVPECIRYYKKLKKLSLGGVYRDTVQILKFEIDINKSIAIPKWIGELKNLEYLYLGQWVTKIPENIQHLKNLRRMESSGSKIKTLPESFGNLKSLRDWQSEKVEVF